MKVAFLLPLSFVLLSQLACSGSPAGSGNTAVSGPVCQILKDLVPKMDNAVPEAAQAQLVMAVGDAYEYDGEKLRTVGAEIDAATKEACPAEREKMLSILKMQSLSQAVR